MIDIKVEYKNYAKPLDAKGIRKVFKDLVVDEGKEVKALYTHLMANFSPKNRSRILRKYGSGSSPVGGQKGSVYVAVGTNRTDGPLVWLEDGTKVRYRTMSFDWKSKTSPGGGINVGIGRGRPLGFGVHAGIAARNFRDDIVQRRYPRFISKAEVAFFSMFKGARWI